MRKGEITSPAKTAPPTVRVKRFPVHQTGQDAGQGSANRQDQDHQGQGCRTGDSGGAHEDQKQGDPEDISRGLKKPVPGVVYPLPNLPFVFMPGNAGKYLPVLSRQSPESP